MRHGPKIFGGSEERPKAKARTDRSIKKKGALDKYFNHGGQWGTQKISEGGESFVTIVSRHKSTLGEVPKTRPFYGGPGACLRDHCKGFRVHVLVSLMNLKKHS